MFNTYRNVNGFVKNKKDRTIVMALRQVVTTKYNNIYVEIVVFKGDKQFFLVVNNNHQRINLYDYKHAQ